MLTKAHKLLASFKNNMVEILNSNLKLEYLMKKTSNKEDKKYVET